MAPQKPRSDQKPKKKVQRLSVAMKKEIIQKHQRGVRVKDRVQEYGLPKSTVCTFVKNKEKIMVADVAKGVVGVAATKRPQVLDKVEQLLMVWITDMQLKGDTISETSICEKAKKLYRDLMAELPATSDTSPEDFKASRGWFQNFRKRSGIQPKSAAFQGNKSYLL